MADLQDELTTEESAVPQPASKPDRPKAGKKRKKRGCGFFLILALLASGVAAGVQASGGADMRPYVYEVVPRIPFVGKKLASLFGIPETYSLTTDERRRIELDEWEVEIAKRARSLDAQIKAAEAASKDLTRREREVEEARENLRARIEALSGDMGGSGENFSAEQRDELERIVKTFEEMSPKNAAAILEKLDGNLAVSVLDQLTEDFRAKTLGRMDAEMAAALMERLSEYQRRKP